MKRIFLFALLISAVVILPVTAGYAQAMDPGCNQDVWNLLSDQANAIRARNRAYERDIINREPSALYLTCFDQSMALSARLGYIFSDVIPPGPPPPNTLVFTDPLAYPDWGAQESLAVSLNNVVTPELDNYLDSVIPAPALFNFLPQWVPPNALTTLTITLTPIIASIQAFQLGNQAAVQAYIAQVQAINTLVNSLPNTPLTTLPATLITYTTLTAALDAAVASFEAAETAAMTPLLTQLQTAVMGTTVTCTNLDDVWSGANNFANPASTDWYPPEGTYYPLTPYYTMGGILSNGSNNWSTSDPTVFANTLTLPPNPPATADFVTELQDATDSAVLTQALTDLATGPFSAPGLSADWPAPPLFNLSNTGGNTPTTVTDIINAM